MKIVVLAKQVPDTNAPVELAEATWTGAPVEIPWIVNPYDEMAVEEAVRIKEDRGARVTVVSFTRPDETEALRKSVAMGADRAVAILDEFESGDRYRDGLALANIFAAALKTMPFDLILAGQRAVDDDASVVGPALAEKLGIPLVSMVTKQKIIGRTIRCKKQIAGGTMNLEAELPALLTVTRGLNTPRYATLPGLKRADRQGVENVRLSDIVPDEKIYDWQPSRLVSLERQYDDRMLKMARGNSAEEKAADLAKLLRAEAGAL